MCLCPREVPASSNVLDMALRKLGLRPQAEVLPVLPGDARVCTGALLHAKHPLPTELWLHPRKVAWKDSTAFARFFFLILN